MTALLLPHLVLLLIIVVGLVPFLLPSPAFLKDGTRHIPVLLPLSPPLLRRLDRRFQILILLLFGLLLFLGNVLLALVVRIQLAQGIIAQQMGATICR